MTEMLKKKLDIWVKCYFGMMYTERYLVQSGHKEILVKCRQKDILVKSRENDILVKYRQIEI